MKSSIAFLLMSPTILSPFVQSLAQSQNQSTARNNTKNDSTIITCPVYVTLVKVVVRDQNGEEVSGLRKDDFIIYEDGVRQTIVFWTDDGDPETEGKQSGYAMAYYPIKYPFDGKFRRIRVAVQTKVKSKLRVEFSPKGYYAKKELLK